MLAAESGGGRVPVVVRRGVVSEDAATEFLTRFKAYLELPLRLLA